VDIAILGFGAIGRLLYRQIAVHTPGIRVTAVLSRADAAGDSAEPLLPHTRRLHTLEDLLALRPALVVECAGHAALRDAGAAVLSAGCDLLVASVGALAAAAAAGGARLRIPAGALGGLDVLGAARFAGLSSVLYTSRKATRAWCGTAAESLVDLDGLHEATVFFRGSAREAALRFPQNANVAAAVALAGAGFDATRVHLVADPQATGNRHDIHASGDFGEIDVSVLGNTLADNPKTSLLAPYSLVRCLANLSSGIVVA
jgi:aspartate dehydrogenase